MTRTTEQVAIDELISELIELRKNAPKHSMSDNAKNLAAKASATLSELASIANEESGFMYDGDWSDFNEPLQDGVNDAFHLVNLTTDVQPQNDPNKEHMHGHREYGLEGA